MAGLVSVVTPTYNLEKFIGATIESALGQTYAEIELIVVDDCSTDGTAAAVEKYAGDRRLRFTRLERNMGPAAARTRAMELARGRYIAFLDGDDLWKPDKLDRQIAFMEENHYPFSCTAYEQVDEAGRPLGRVIGVKRKCNYNGLLLTCPVGNSTVVYDVQALGKFRVPDIRKRNDDALFLQILKKTPYIYGLAEPLAQYRLRPGSVSSNKLSLVKYHWQLYREIEGLSVARSAFHVGVWGFLKLFHIK